MSTRRRRDNKRRSWVVRLRNPLPVLRLEQFDWYGNTYVRMHG